ncbi:MAG: hypothetical protein AAB535_02780 [Patescibacteria group bacterium]
MKKFTNYQLKTLIDIFVGVGMIGVGTIAIPVALDRGSLEIIGLGIATSFMFWYTAIKISRQIQ